MLLPTLERQHRSHERITRAQQMMRESKRSLIEIALEVGYTSPSAFAANLPPRGRRYTYGSLPLVPKLLNLSRFGGYGGEERSNMRSEET